MDLYDHQQTPRSPDCKIETIKAEQGKQGLQIGSFATQTPPQQSASSKMTRSENQSAPPPTNSEDHQTRLDDTKEDAVPTMTSNPQPTIPAQERGRRPPQTHDPDHATNATLPPSQQRHRTNRPVTVNGTSTPTPPLQSHNSNSHSHSHNHDHPSAERRHGPPTSQPLHQPNNRPTTATTATATAAAEDDDEDEDRNRRHGFRLGDLVIDVFLAHPIARVQDTPVYQVISLHPDEGVYRLRLHRDPTGRAPLWTVRNWGQIRLEDREERWEELD